MALGVRMLLGTASPAVRKRGLHSGVVRNPALRQEGAGVRFGASLSHSVLHETLSQKEEGGCTQLPDVLVHCSPSTVVVAQELKASLGCRVKPYLNFF